MTHKWLLIIIFFSFINIAFSDDVERFECICTSYGFDCVGKCKPQEKIDCIALCNYSIYKDMFKPNPYLGKGNQDR